MKPDFRLIEGGDASSWDERLYRLIFGLGVFIAVVALDGPLVVLALGLLLAIYPVMTLFLSWDPAYRAATREADNVVHVCFKSRHGRAQLRTLQRLERAFIAAVLIAIPFVVSGEQAWETVFAVLGVFPLISALSGVDLIRAARRPEPRPGTDPGRPAPGSSRPESLSRAPDKKAA